jgi:opacity protein-like surface antigen
MRQLKALSLLLLAPTLSYAVNPVNGLYIGGGVGGSFTARNDSLIFSPINGVTSVQVTDSEVTYTPGIDGIGELGYRKDKFRVELQTYFNLNNYDKLTLNNVEFPNSTTDLKGNMNMIGEMVNVFYDHFTKDHDGTTKSFFPYLGGGLGIVYVTNAFNFYQAGVKVGSANDQSTTTYGFQAIIGGAMFFDDYSFAAIDYRFVGTGNVSALNGPVHTSTINLVLNFSFETADNFKKTLFGA